MSKSKPAENAKVSLCKWTTDKGSKAEIKGGPSIPFVVSIMAHSCSDKEIKQMRIDLEKILAERKHDKVMKS